MLQPSEVVCLFIALVLLPIVVTSSRSVWNPLRTYILAALFAIVAGNTFTIIEGFILFDLFNTLEHAAFAVAGVITLGAFLSLRRIPATPRDGTK